MKNIIVVTGGAGFVGSNLIKSLLKKTNKRIISLDNYSSGNKKNHVKDIRVRYIRGETIDIAKNLNFIKNQIHSIFHFGEFAEFIKVLTNLKNVLDQILSVQMLSLNFVWIKILSLFIQQHQPH